MGYSESEGNKQNLQRKKWISNLIPFAVAAILTYIAMKIFKFDFSSFLSEEEYVPLSYFEKTVWPIIRWPTAIACPIAVFFTSQSYLPKKIRESSFNIWICLLLCGLIYFTYLREDSFPIKLTFLTLTTLCFFIKLFFPGYNDEETEYPQSEDRNNTHIDLN